MVATTSTMLAGVRPWTQPEHVQLSRIRTPQALYAFHCGGLAGPVGPEQPEALPVPGVQGHVRDRHDVAVDLAKPSNRHRLGIHVISLLSGIALQQTGVSGVTPPSPKPSAHSRQGSVAACGERCPRSSRGGGR